MTRLTGKTAVVTGVANGPAARIAARLAAEGAAVVINDAADSEGASRLAAEIVRRGGRAVAIEGDVSKSQDVRRIFRAAVEIFGRPNIVINNAGIVRVEPQQVEADANRTFAVDVFGTFLMCQEAARQFAGKGGIIINMSATANANPDDTTPDEETQSTIKSAIDMLTLGLARDFAERGIRVISIDPAGFDAENLYEPDLPEKTARHIPALKSLRRGRLPGAGTLAAADDIAFIRNELVASTGWRGW
ncbi:SDR family NAD(P)-dependent oxidoreductase [Rhizobium sp. RCAM05350]|nr:SDR family NAD(P)-dependent oxidoreductase [Rhizobium sp. RCAM05350]